MAWSSDGLVIGAVIGGTSGSFSKTIKGLLGGSAGGFAGGAFFDALSLVVGGALVSRLFGFIIEGLAIGVGIGLVQELTKQAWLIAEAGRLRGRQFRIDRPVTRLGRSEESDIGLFGDPQVSYLHAAIEKRGSQFAIRPATAREYLTVNDQPVGDLRSLNEGDRITIGGYVLRFHRQHERLRSRAPLAAPRNGAPRPSALATEGAILTTPDGSRYFLWPASPITIGRDSGNIVVLPTDDLTSRFHAVITLTAEGARLDDLKSSNGTLVNGRAITTTLLSDGDTITVGRTHMIFRGPT